MQRQPKQSSALNTVYSPLLQRRQWIQSLRHTESTGWPRAGAGFHNVLWFCRHLCESVYFPVGRWTFSSQQLKLVIDKFSTLNKRVTLDKNNDVGRIGTDRKDKTQPCPLWCANPSSCAETLTFAVWRWTELYICHGHFGNVSKANRPAAYLRTKECSLSVSLVFLSENLQLETGRNKPQSLLQILL